eukprot:13862477-Ditylum_brightwellii.AAC.1
MLNNTRTLAVSPASVKHSKYRVGFFGDTRVGKTLIVKRYVYDQFEHAPSPTIGINFLSKLVCLKNCTVRLSTWDTVGEPRVCPSMPSYVQDSEADLSNGQVGTTEGEKQAKMDGLLFMECSAKSGDNM